MFLLNLVALAIHEYMTGTSFMSTLGESQGVSIFFVLYMTVLFIGDVTRAFD